MPFFFTHSVSKLLLHSDYTNRARRILISPVSPLEEAMFIYNNFIFKKYILYFSWTYILPEHIEICERYPAIEIGGQSFVYNFFCLRCILNRQPRLRVDARIFLNSRRARRQKANPIKKYEIATKTVQCKRGLNYNDVFDSLILSRNNQHIACK